MLIGVLARVFSQRRYVIAGLVAAMAFLSAIVFLPHTALVSSILTSSASIGVKLKFLLSLYASLTTKYSMLGALNIVLTSVLFGMNISLLVYYIRRRQAVSHDKHVHLAGIGGLVSSLLGIGCAACGSVVVTAVLGLFGASGLLLILPFHGAEFGLVGLVLLCLSIYYVGKRINDPWVCPLSLKDL